MRVSGNVRARQSWISEVLTRLVSGPSAAEVSVNVSLRKVTASDDSIACALEDTQKVRETVCTCARAAHRHTPQASTRRLPHVTFQTRPSPLLNVPHAQQSRHVKRTR